MSWANKSVNTGMCVGALVFGTVYGRYGPVAMYLSTSCFAAVCFVSYTTLYLAVPALHAPPRPSPSHMSAPSESLQQNSKLAGADAHSDTGAAAAASTRPNAETAENAYAPEVLETQSQMPASPPAAGVDTAAGSAPPVATVRVHDELADDADADAAQQAVALVPVPHSETAQSFASCDSEAPLLHSSPSRKSAPESRPLSDIPEHSVPSSSSNASEQQASLRERMASARSRFFLA